MTTNNIAGIDLAHLEALARAANELRETIQPFVSTGGQLVIGTFSMSREEVDVVAHLYDALPPATVLQLIELARRSTSGSDDSAYQRGYLDGIAKGRRDASEDRAEASGSDGTAAAPMDRLHVTEAMIDAYLAFTARSAYLNHPEVPYHGTVNGDSEDLWKRRMAAAAIRAALARRPATSRSELADERTHIKTWQERMSDAFSANPKGNFDVIKIESIRAEIADLRAALAQQAGAPALLNSDELAALRRFNETCEDGEGYDVRKPMMQRLAEIGAVRRTSGSYYEITDFGMHVLGAAPAPAAQDDKELADVLNTTLWLYRRLPQAYGNPPFVDAAILKMAERLGLDDVPEAIKERAAMSQSKQGTAGQEGAA